MKQSFEVVKLSDVCNCETSNLALKNLENNFGEYSLYGASGFIKNVDFYKQDKDYIGIVKDGAGIGRVMLLERYSSILGTMQYIIPKENINIKYLYYNLIKMNLSKYFTGSTIPHIYFKDYKNEKIFLRTLSEQKKISNILDNVSKILEMKKQQLSEFDKLVKFQFLKMFGDLQNNPKGFPIVTLEELGKWSSGGTPPRAKREYYTGNIDWYSAGELNSLYLNGSLEKITTEAINNSTAKLFKAGSMLIGMYDTAAFKMGILKKLSSSNQACACIEPNEKINIVWLYYALLLLKNYFLHQRRGVRQKNLNLGMIKSFKIPYVDKKEQNKFADFIKQVDKSKVILGKALKSLSFRLNYYYMI